MDTIKQFLNANKWQLSLYLVIFICISIVGFQTFLDKRAIANQNEKIRAFETEQLVSKSQMQLLIDQFKESHAITLKKLDELSKFDETIAKKREADRKQDELFLSQRLKENYDNARNAKNTTINKNNPVVSPTPILDVRRLEQDVWANDAELYGPNTTGSPESPN